MFMGTIIIKRAMWLVSFVIIATVSGQSQAASSRSYLDAATTGFDPFYITALTQPNPGRRSKLFQPLTYVDKTVLDSFVNEEQDINYLPEITVQKIMNFPQYIDFTASSAYELSSATDCGEPVHRYVNYSSCKTKNSQRDRAMHQFFKDTGGEVLFAKTEIITHSITISSFVITTFTPAFEKAVEALYKAAVNTVSEITKSTFNEFVRLYGTHFSRRTLLGSRAIFGKLFSARAATVVEESARRRCVLEAVREALTPCMRGCNETTQTVFTRASSGCGEEEHEPIVAVTGLLPERNLDDWSSTAKNSPTPIFHELEPLSTLFTAEWFEEYFDKIQVRINGIVLSQYFEENYSDYSRRMAIEGSNSPHFRGCGLSSDCQIGTECRNEPGTESGFSCIPMEGPVLMMGGYNNHLSGSASYLSSGEAIGTWTLPHLPYQLQAATLTAVGSKIYSCGGKRHGTESRSECYVFDRAQHSQRWDSIAPLPIPMHYHTSVTIKDHIWTVYSGKLYDLNTKTNKFYTYQLPMTVSSAHCAVSNESHSFIIGAGASRNEIWVNTEEYNPAKWNRVGYLSAGRKYFGCVLFGQEVFITGGETSLSESVIFDTETNALRTAGTLVEGRQDHQMMVFEGKPAVVGGHISGPSIGTIETYDQRALLWTTSPRLLEEVRHGFGLVQLRG